MFKKLTILVLISLLVLTAATACSSKATEEAVPPVTAATEQKPATSDTPTAPATTSEPQTTPETTPAVKENPGNPISVPEFIKNALNGKYKSNDVVIVSGTVLREKPQTVDQYRSFEFLLGPETSGYTVTVKSETVKFNTKTKRFHFEDSESYVSFVGEEGLPENTMVFPKTDVRAGDTIVVRGTNVWVWEKENTILLKEAFLVELVRK
jgi:hypothetical protein